MEILHFQKFFLFDQNFDFFDENSISKVLKKLFSGLVMWRSDSICSTMSIFDSIWKFNLKTSEFSRLLIQIRKRTKTLKFVFQNIKKWTCEFSSADFLKNGKFWQKINLEDLKVKFQTRNNLWSMKKYNRNFVNIREWYLRGNFTSDKSVPARLRAW